MADLYASGGQESAVFALEARPRTTSSSSAAEARSIDERDLGDPPGRGPRDARSRSELWIWPVPHGPRGRLARRAVHERLLGLEVREEQGRRRAVPRGPLRRLRPGDAGASKLFNFPSFPGAFPLKQIYAKAAAADTQPADAASTRSSRRSRRSTRATPGTPGTSNAAVQEVLDTFLIPQMFARVSQGTMSAEDSVRATASEMKRIWAKWRAAGKL